MTNVPKATRETQLWVYPGDAAEGLELWSAAPDLPSQRCWNTTGYWPLYVYPSCWEKSPRQSAKPKMSLRNSTQGMKFKGRVLVRSRSAVSLLQADIRVTPMI